MNITYPIGENTQSQILRTRTQPERKSEFKEEVGDRPIDLHGF